VESEKKNRKAKGRFLKAKCWGKGRMESCWLPASSVHMSVGTYILGKVRELGRRSGFVTRRRRRGSRNPRESHR